MTTYLTRQQANGVASSRRWEAAKAANPDRHAEYIKACGEARAVYDTAIDAALEEGLDAGRLQDAYVAANAAHSIYNSTCMQVLATYCRDTGLEG